MVATPATAPATQSPARRRRRPWVRFMQRLALTVVAVWVAATAAAAGYVGLSGDGPPRPRPPGHLVQTGDVVTHYEQWGSSGSPIVLVPGFLESTVVWSRLGPLLGRDHRVYAVDVRGFGYSERRGPYDLAADADQLAAFLLALRLDAAHRSQPMLVGHSSGAAIAGEVVRRDRAAASRVVFLDGDGTPYGVGPAWVHRVVVDPYATAMIRLLSRHPAIAARRIYAAACGPGCPPFDAQAWLAPLRGRDSEGALTDLLRHRIIGLTYAEEEQIHTPAAVLYGVADPTMTAATAADTARRLHTNLVVPIAHARHLPMLSAPESVAAALEGLQPR